MTKYVTGCAECPLLVVNDGTFVRGQSCGAENPPKRIAAFEAPTPTTPPGWCQIRSEGGVVLRLKQGEKT